MKAIILLVISNTFMTLAWYGHLRFKEKPLWLMILASWGIAFFEYLFQVPANRLGSYQFSVTRRNRNGGPLHYFGGEVSFARRNWAEETFCAKKRFMTSTI